MSYGSASKLLHYLALDSRAGTDLLFDIEQVLYGRGASSAVNGEHVFVSGMARAGTTILMRAIYETGEFASLTYRDMPFVMAPNLWSKLTQKSTRRTRKELRAHGDRIWIDFDSPEALEEVFWRAKSGEEYIREHKLIPHDATPETIEAFRRYVSLINLRYAKKRYLSKNNNNALRLYSISAAFPNAIIIIPFRDPLQQAQSLLTQHKKFCARHQANRFSKQYMSWLVHHEFGLDHRPFHFDGDAMTSNQTVGIDYWLLQWTHTYRHLMKIHGQAPHNIIFVGYEELCRTDDKLWRSLCNRIAISGRNPNFIANVTQAPTTQNVNLASGAKALYAKLSELSRQQLGLC